MKKLGPVLDPTDVAKPSGAIDRWIVSYLKDARDLPFLYLILKITLTIIPLAILLYLPFISGGLWWVIASLYLVLNNFVFKGPFGLMFHCTSHRPLFQSNYQMGNYCLPWVLGPFFGQTPETYFSHHIGMHHAENNMPEDESSTMTYQRDSLRDFLRYYGDFMLTGVAGLVSYLIRKKRRKLANRALVGEMSFFVLCIVLSLINLPATLVAFIIPFFIFRIITMLGNWTQHSFVEADDPSNPYKNSITCINVKYNKKCWNDGYHISHHERPAMHWSEHPAYFQKTIHKYAINQAIVFDGLDFLQVFFYLMRKRYNVLARHVVNINDAFCDEEDIIRTLKRRTKPIAVKKLVSAS